MTSTSTHRGYIRVYRDGVDIDCFPVASSGACTSWVQEDGEYGLDGYYSELGYGISGRNGSLHHAGIVARAIIRAMGKGNRAGTFKGFAWIYTINSPLKD